MFFYDGPHSIEETKRAVEYYAPLFNDTAILIFDDSFEHEVFHNGTGDRIILLFDIWHPEIEKEERVAIIEMFDLAKKNGWISGHRES